jgi:hypothetical protein
MALLKWDYECNPPGKRERLGKGKKTAVGKCDLSG